MSLEQPTLSVVIPAYNESIGIAQNIKTIIDIIERCGISWEILLIDDGSRDQTYTIISQMAEQDTRIKAIGLSRNFGKEAALFSGLEHARGKAVITIDADLQHPPQLIPAMLEKWQAGAQIVHAVKRNRNKESLGKTFSAYLMSQLISKLGGININNSSDFKLLDREIVDIIIHKLPERERFYRGLTSWIGFNEAYLEFDVEDRQGDRSKWSIYSLVELVITALTSFSSMPLRIITLLGFVTLILGFFIASETLWSLWLGQSVSGFATIIITLLIIGSFIMISLGIIGEYIAKIYQEVKARPLYFVKASVGIDKKNEKLTVTKQQHRP